MYCAVVLDVFQSPSGGLREQLQWVGDGAGGLLALRKCVGSDGRKRWWESTRCDGGSFSEIFERLPTLPINVVSGNTSYVNTVGTDIDGWFLGGTQRVYLTEDVFSQFPDNAYRNQIAIHELAHIYTLNWRLINEPMAVLNLQQCLESGTVCDPTIEYLAETVTNATTGHLTASYYHGCIGKWN